MSDQPLRLKTERDRFVALAFCWADIVLELDAGYRIQFAGGATQALLGRQPADLTGKSLVDVIAPQDRLLAEQLLKLADRMGRIETATLHLQGVHGVTPPVAMAGYRLEELNRHFFLAMHMGTGVAEGGAAGLHSRDGETGLFDGDSFAEVAVERLKAFNESGNPAQMTLVSLPEFAELSERLEDATEQSLLNAVGACFRASSADGDSAARIADDRYGLIHHPDLDVEGLEKDLEEITREVDPEGHGISVESATVDLTDPAVSEEDMANSLVYVVNRFREAKEGTFTIKSLSTNLSSLVSEAAERVDVFKRVVANSSFDLAFQPIVDVKTGEVHHYEALTRFHGGKKDEFPYQQIAFAEETGLISEFDLATVRKAVGWLGQWPRNTTRYRIALNISGFSIGTDAYVSGLHAILKDNAWVADKLLFEITESSRMADLDSANSFIQGLRKDGYHVCLDDFGSGAASFQYMSALDVDVVKLDGSAIRNAQKGAKGKAFLSALTGLCKGLAVETIAEMVDSEQSLKFVRECGVDYVQGYLFGKPSIDIKDFTPLPQEHLFRAPGPKDFVQKRK